LTDRNLNEFSDEELILEFQTNGTEKAFEILVQRFKNPLTNFVYRFLGDYDSCADIVQDTFVKVYRYKDSYSSLAKFSTWIYKIAHNAAIDHLRRVSTRDQSLTIESDGAEYEIPLKSAKPTPEQESERRERRTEIEAVVGQLPLAYRNLILLRHSQDMSYDEIAEVTGLPLGTVKNRLFRAREMMREQFIQRGITGI